jgi:effector-binding domain-containing protein
MVRENKIYKTLIFISIVIFFLSVSTAADNNSHFEEFKDDPNFIACRGKIPETINRDWENSINKCWINITKNTYHSDFHPSVNGLGCTDSYLSVELDSKFEDEIKESTIDEIYRKISHYCEQEGVNEVPVVFTWSYDDSLPLPDYGPGTLEEARKDSQFVASRGTMPVITTEGEKRIWLDQLGRSIRDNRDVDQYFKEHGGPVIGFGLSINGYVFIYFDSNAQEKVNESLINEIYQVIENHSKQKGIDDIPVVFMWGEEEVETLAAEVPSPVEEFCVIDDDGNVTTYTADEAYLDEEGNLVIRENETTNQIPGFTLPMLVLSFLLLSKRKK